MNNWLKLTVLVIGIMYLTGCAKQIEIKPDLIAGHTANVIVKDDMLKNFITVPLISYKYTNVSIYTGENSCPSGRSFDKDGLIGSMRLTPKAPLQDVVLPAGKELFINITSTENVGGNMLSCYSVMSFTPDKNKKYIVDFQSPKSIRMGLPSCKFSVVEKVAMDGKVYDLPVASLKGYKQDAKGSSTIVDKSGNNICKS